MREGNGPSPAEMGIKQNLIDQDAPKTEAEAKKNQEYFQTMNALFMADREGRNIPVLLAADSKLEKSVKEILASDEYNPEHLSMEQIQGQSARESTPGEKGTQNKWKNMIQLPDGRSVANPFAVAAGLGRKTEQQGAQNREPVVKPVVETGETPVKETGETTRPGAGGETGGDTGVAERARAEAETAKADRDAAQAAEDAQKIEQLTDMWMANDPNNAPDRNLSEGGAQEGFARAKRTITDLSGSSTTSYRADLPGSDVGRQGYQVGGSDIQPLPAEAKPSVVDRLKGGWKKLFGAKEASVTVGEQPINLDTGETPLDAWMANGPEATPDRNLSAGGKQEGFRRPLRTETEGTVGASTTSFRTELPGIDRRNNSAQTEQNPSEQTEEEFKKAA